MSAGEIFLTRLFALDEADRRHELVVKFWRPEPAQETCRSTPIFTCAIEVVGLPSGVFQSSASGGDSLQALASAYTVVRRHLSAFRENLTWIGLPFEELPLVVAISDAGRRMRIDDILNEEEYAAQDDMRRRTFATTERRRDTVRTETEE